MYRPPPYDGHRPFNWPSVLLALGGFALTDWLIFRFVQTATGAHYRPSLLALLYLLAAAAPVGCLVWLISFAHGFTVRSTVTFGLALGMLADLMFLQGLTNLYSSTLRLEFIEFLFNLLLVVSLMILAGSGNADGLRRQARERRAHETDALTGLLNRKGVARCYAELPADALVTVVMLDLNDLKSFNDLGGHSAGDLHLVNTARALSRRQVKGMSVGRWGGDEFVLLVPEQLPNPLDLEAMLAAAGSEIGLPPSHSSAFMYGAATVLSGTPLERVLALADQQMYEAKARRQQPSGKSLQGSAAGDEGVSDGDPGDGGAGNRETGKGDTGSGAVPEDRQVTLTDFSHFLLGLNTVDEILNVGLSRASELAGFEAWFYARPGEQLELVYQERQGDPGQEVVSVDSRQQSTLVQAVMEHRRMVWAADYEHSAYAQPFWVKLGIKSVVAAPVMIGQAAVGAVAFVSRHTWHSVTPQAKQLLETVATHLGYQLERQAVLRTMQDSVEASIIGMGVILEARDLETAGHTARVVELSARLGQSAGLDAQELNDLRLGAYLHDVGKLAIPDAVLLKPGPLDKAEWSLMKSHTARGAAMVARLPSVPQAALEVVYSHHERWDGQGYPQGLDGERIPRLARIFSLCDVYDALISPRPYKRAWTPQEARNELSVQSGRQFDPELTALFLEQVVGPAASSRPEERSQFGQASPPTPEGHRNPPN